jgi:hypothetical protein
MPTETSETNAANGIVCTRRQARGVVALLIVHAILVVISIMPFTVGYPDYSWPRWQSVFIEGLATGEIGLAAVFFVMGSATLPLRVIATAIVFTFWLFVLDDLALDHERWLTIFAIQSIGTLLLLGIARLCGIRLVTECAVKHSQLTARQYHYSLGQLLVWTAAISFLVFLGTAIAHVWHFRQSVDSGVLPRAKVIGLSLALIVNLAAWAILGARRKAVPLAILALITVVASLATGRTDHAVRTAYWSSVPVEFYEIAYWYLITFYAIVVSLSLLAIRTTGYRFIRGTAKSSDSLSVSY